MGVSWCVLKVSFVRRKGKHLKKTKKGKKKGKEKNEGKKNNEVSGLSL